MKVYIVVELDKDSVPRIVGVYSTRDKPERMVTITLQKNNYSKWVNVVEKEVQ